MVYQHIGPLPDNWCDQDYIKLASTNAVRDRYHLSETAYSLTLNRDSKIRDLRVLHSTLMLKFSAYTIIIVADPEVIASRYDAKRELFNIEDVIAVNDTFIKMRSYAEYYIHLTTDSPDILDATVNAISDSYLRKQKWIEEWSDIMRNSK